MRTGGVHNVHIVCDVRARTPPPPVPGTTVAVLDASGDRRSCGRHSHSGVILQRRIDRHRLVGALDCAGELSAVILGERCKGESVSEDIDSDAVCGGGYAIVVGIDIVRIVAGYGHAVKVDEAVCRADHIQEFRIDAAKETFGRCVCAWTVKCVLGIPPCASGFVGVEPLTNAGGFDAVVTPSCAVIVVQTCQLGSGGTFGGNNIALKRSCACWTRICGELGDSCGIVRPSCDDLTTCRKCGGKSELI